MKIRNKNVEIVEAEISLLRIFVSQERERREKTYFWDILNKDNIQRTLTAGACLSVCQVGGQILILAYSTVVLVQSGVSNPFQITVIIFLCQFLGICVGPLLMDKIGRRPVALCGFVMLFLLDAAIGGLACGGLSTKSERLALASLFIIFAFFNSLAFQSL
jgi:MFS family permease